MKIVIARGELLRIEEEGRGAFPNECCGLLLGKWGQSGERQVDEIHPVVNARMDSPQNRYLIPPEEVLQITKQAERRGLEVIGFYHSHPNVAPRPSAFDREHAWPGYGYLIVRVQAGKPQETLGWYLGDDREEFLEAEVAVVESAPSSSSDLQGA